MGTDCLPDTLLQTPDPRIINKVFKFVNAVFKMKKIPEPFQCARLHLINKLRFGTPSIEDIRPIMISSPLMKLIESIALEEIRRKLEPAITSAQIGFISGLGTHIHILRLLGRMIDIRNSDGFRSGDWFVLFIDFRAAFDKIDHQIMFDKLRRSDISESTVNIIKLLYNAYHFSLLQSESSKINEGVAQGSLLSPLIYNWYVNDLISHLSKRLNVDNTYAFADDLAQICLGYSDISLALTIIQDWCSRNGASLNKRKCGILPIRKRKTAPKHKEFESIPIVSSYKYLGIPVDSALTLEDLKTQVKEKIKRFNRRIGLIFHNVIGTATKLSLWQSYARCYFEYASPAIAICSQCKKFDSAYTSSLKKALDLPLQLPNSHLLKVIGIPTLNQIAGYQVNRNRELIETRFGKCPSSLISVAENLKQESEQYRALKKTEVITELCLGRYQVDIRAIAGSILNKEFLGLATGAYLTLRQAGNTQGKSAVVKKCLACNEDGTQAHYLNRCPINAKPRNDLLVSIPKGFRIPLLSNGEFSEYYKVIRELEIYAKRSKPTAELLEPLAKATMASAKEFVKVTLAANSPKATKGSSQSVPE